MVQHICSVVQTIADQESLSQRLLDGLKMLCMVAEQSYEDIRQVMHICGRLVSTYVNRTNHTLILTDLPPI